jgi:hypothetical protein
VRAFFDLAKQTENHLNVASVMSLMVEMLILLNFTDTDHAVTACQTIKIAISLLPMTAVLRSK